MAPPRAHQAARARMRGGGGGGGAGSYAFSLACVMLLLCLGCIGVVKAEASQSTAAAAERRRVSASLQRVDDEALLGPSGKREDPEDEDEGGSEGLPHPQSRPLRVAVESEAVGGGAQGLTPPPWSAVDGADDESAGREGRHDAGGDTNTRAGASPHGRASANAYAAREPVGIEMLTQRVWELFAGGHASSRRPAYSPISDGRAPGVVDGTPPSDGRGGRFDERPACRKAGAR